MSNKDPPPSGPDNRTIIRPNPGGRRTVDTPAAARAVPVAGEQPIPTPRSPPAAPPVGGEVGEDWITAAAVSARPAGAAGAATAPVRMDELFAPNSNPLMRAAGPLLLMLGRLRAALLRAPFASLMEQVAKYIQAFDKDVHEASVPAEQAKTAKYIVCATADDIVQNIPNDDRQVWTQYSMLSRFFGERIGGVRFFDEIERAKVDPAVNYPLLELQHACLALGFQGRYRSSGGGAATLQQIQRSLYETLRRARPRVEHDLSPNWRGQSLSARRPGFQVPVWGVGAVLGALLFTLFLTLRYLLSGGAELASDSALNLFSHAPISMARAVFAPPPPPPAPTPTQLTQLQRIRTALAPEISAGTIAVPDPTGPYWIVIDVGDRLLFASGEATVLPSFKPLAARMTAMLEKEFGTIKVVGHTDNQPLGRFSPFKSNYDLSVARATNVTNILKIGLSHPERLKVEGKGADESLGSNSTEQGRAKNRRVEVLVQRTD
jgi:type VI secretion system protein ImpK